MKLPLATIMLFALIPAARAQTNVVGDAWITGPVMVGTTTQASSRLYVVASSATEVAFQVSGVDLTPFLRVAKDGKVGLSTYSAANLDINGSGDSSNIGLMLHGGNLYQSGTTRAQIAFGQDGTTNRRHAISSVHSDSTTNNSLDFLIWTLDAGSATSMASMTVVSLITVAGSTGSAVHVRPAGVPTHHLTVSNGNALGQGIIHAATKVTPSSREWKSDITYANLAEEKTAYEHVRGLTHVSFRYARQKNGRHVRDSKAPIYRGLIYEDAPPSLRGVGASLSVDQRLVESEMAFKELTRRLDALDQEAGR